MPLRIGFWKDFNGFSDPKWNQVGTKMGSKIDINLKRREGKTYLLFQKNFKDFAGFGGRSLKQKSKKNRSKKSS